MSKVEITIASWDYDRVRPLIDGRVSVEGCDVNYLTMSPEECFHRTYFHREFEVSEIGFSPYLIALSRGVAPYRAIPVFLSRSFRHNAIYIRTDRGIDKPSDLKGKKIGVPEYQMSAVLWARGMLHDEHGVVYRDIQWRQGGQEQPGRRDKFELNLPKDFPLESIPDDKTLAGMLADGELDAIISARAPSCFLGGHPAVGRLYEDFAEAEREYFKRTGIFPIMHALGVRNDVLERHPWIAASLNKAFTEAKRISAADLDEVVALKIGLPWLASDVARTKDVMGNDFWPYGVEANRRTLEAMIRYSYEQGLCVRPLSVDELFVASTLEETKI